MKNIGVYNLLKFAAIAGNALYVLWSLINGINESFNGTIVEIISYIGLMLLLILNSVLLYRKGTGW